MGSEGEEQGSEQTLAVWPFSPSDHEATVECPTATGGWGGGGGLWQKQNIINKKTARLGHMILFDTYFWHTPSTPIPFTVSTRFFTLPRNTSNQLFPLGTTLHVSLCSYIWIRHQNQNTTTMHGSTKHLQLVLQVSEKYKIHPTKILKRGQATSYWKWETRDQNPDSRQTRTEPRRRPGPGLWAESGLMPATIWVWHRTSNTSQTVRGLSAMHVCHESK